MISRQQITSRYPIAHFCSCDIFIDAVNLFDNKRQLKDIINELTIKYELRPNVIESRLQKISRKESGRLEEYECPF